MEADQQTNHERVRRELWAAVYRQAQIQSATRVQPEFCYAEAADTALARFDKRFGTHGVPATDEAQRLRELLRRTQTYVCGNRDLMGASELCGEIAEALAATKHLRTPGVNASGEGQQ